MKQVKIEAFKTEIRLRNMHFKSLKGFLELLELTCESHNLKGWIFYDNPTFPMWEINVTKYFFTVSIYFFFFCYKQKKKKKLKLAQPTSVARSISF